MYYLVDNIKQGPSNIDASRSVTSAGANGQRIGPRLAFKLGDPSHSHRRHRSIQTANEFLSSMTL